MGLGLDYTICVVLCGIIMIGMLSGVVGVFVLLRGQSLLGDAIAHAALPGIALAFLLTQSKNPFLLFIGGACSGAVGMVLVTLVTMQTRLKKDAAQGMVLSIFFGLGLVLITVIQKQVLAGQAVLNKFLFGNVATLLYSELWVIAAITCLLLLCIKICWKEIVMFVFDGFYINSIGFGYWLIVCLWAGILLCTIVVGLQTVGVILMSTMLIAPAAAARQWTSSVGSMTYLAGFFGAFSGVVGVLLSGCVPGMPTGPVIVVVASAVVIISLVCAPYYNAIMAKKVIYKTAIKEQL